MSQTNKLGYHITITLLLLVCLVPIIFGRPHRFMGRKEYLPYTRHLPHIDKVELLKLKVIADRWNGDILSTKVLQGTEAQKVASLWRRQTYTSSQSACHNPAYAIKFYARGKLQVYASICWSCNNIFMLTPKLSRTQNFLGENRKGAQLSEVFDSAFRAAR